MPINQPCREPAPVFGERLPRPEEVRRQQEQEAADRRKKHDAWSFEQLRHEIQTPKPTA